MPREWERGVDGDRPDAARVPHVEKDDEGRDVWVLNGVKIATVAAGLADAPSTARARILWENAPALYRRADTG
jgi:hypothetical protein